MLSYLGTPPPPPGGVRVPPRGGTQSGTPRVRVPPRGGTQSGTPRVRVPPGGVPGQVPPRGGLGNPPGGYPVRYPPGGVQVPPRGVPGQVPPRGGVRVPPPPAASWHSGKCCKALWDMGTPPPPRCGQTNKVKLLPSRRTTYAGGNKKVFQSKANRPLAGRYMGCMYGRGPVPWYGAGEGGPFREQTDATELLPSCRLHLGQ